jgi:nucleotide-binding universal stress UspA family protein
MFYRIRDIVAAIASPEDDPILVPAVELATRCGAFLHFVHAPEVADLVGSDSAHAGEPAGGSAHALARQVEFGAGDRLDYHAVDGPPGRAILGVAKKVLADLIIVGGTRRRRLPAALFGSTARRVCREADVPVLVLRGHVPHEVSRVLVATDLSPMSASAQEIALDAIDALFPGEGVAIRALDVAFDDPALAPPLRGTLFDDLALGQLKEYLDQRRQRSRPIEGSVRFGDPVSEIVQEAEDWRADLVVVGSHGLTGAARVVLGSTAEGVLARAKSSVLLVPRAAIDRMIVPAIVPAAPAEPVTT